MDGKYGLVLLGACIALGCTLSAHIISSAAISITRDEVIRVKGFAVTDLRSDYARWSASFSTSSITLQDSFRLMKEQRQEIVKFLLEKGFQKNDISLSSIHTQTDYQLDAKGKRTDFIIGYTLEQHIHIHSQDVKRVQYISGKITELIEQGIHIRSNSPSFTITDLSSVKIELLEKATKDAFNRAQALASNSGGSVGKLHAASQGVFQITTPHSTETSSYGEYNTSTINKHAKAVVTLSYIIE
ncbi:MAG: SIMPL domain-containing protein [Planctomycetes bacterium]|nr:SIMPL domain-containing protein [Planctomycetota bacterium]